MSKMHLVFDTTDADTKLASDNVGAYVRSSDGTLITKTTEGAKDGLDVYVINPSLEVTQGTDPWVIGDGGNSITVDATDLDIRDLTQADEITVFQGTDPWIIGDGGNSITVDATDLDIRDLTAASDSVSSWTMDGAGNAITSTTIGADVGLDVNVIGGVNVEVDLSHTDDSVRLGDGTNFITSTTVGADVGLDVNILNSLTVNDAALANTAIATAQNQLGVANTAEDLVASPLANRKYLFAQNMGNLPAYIGASGVSASTGYPIYPGSEIIMRAGAAIDIEWVASNTNMKMATLELS